MGMAEYIERGLFLKNVKHNAPHIYYMVAPIALITPAADAAPVRHGRWLSWDQLHDGNTLAKNVLGVFCSECSKQSDSKTHFCPNCGAKMDLEDSQCDT